MKQIHTQSLVVGGIVGIVATAATMGAMANQTPQPASLTTPTYVNTGDNVQGTRPERHPELRRALKALNRAKTDLSNAAHDYAGHRERALDLTQQAIAEVHAAIESDRH